ncbi:hypothetical protein LT493_10855 [Streptomyces tricolor]|nr:hypothetical protein [Streptomyces tricolor]
MLDAAGARRPRRRGEGHGGARLQTACSPAACWPAALLGTPGLLAAALPSAPRPAGRCPCWPAPLLLAGTLPGGAALPRLGVHETDSPAGASPPPSAGP